MNFQFKAVRGGEGEPLRLYAAGSDPLFMQVLDGADTALSSILGLVCVHHREKIHQAQRLEPRWDKMKFRAGLLEWIDSLSARSSGAINSVS